MCPSCRLVFKVPRDHDGRGVVCPACRKLLRLPAAGELIPPLVAAERAPARGPADDGHGPDRRRRSRRKHREGASHGEAGPSWESDPRHSRRRDTGMSRGLLWAAGGVLLAVLVLFGVLRVTLGRAGSAAGSMSEREAPLTWGEGLQEQGFSGEGEDGAGGVALSKDERQDEFVAAAARNEPREVLRETESLARRFVAATTAEQMLQLVRHPERAGPRLRAWHAEHGFGLWRIRSFGKGGSLTGRGRMVSAVVVLGDFSTREMGFERTADGYRIDWESWVGWSAITWREFRARRPTEGQEFRVLVKKGNYYNYGFSEGGGYQCYQLDSPDREEFLYGYVKRGTPDDDLLGTADASSSLAWTLELRYPEGAPAAGQVIISRVLAKGWIVEDTSGAEGGEE